MTDADILDYAARVLRSKELAEHWMRKPAIGLDGRRPIDVIATDGGRQLVEDYLGRIEFGVYT